mmetsp:Transcript_1429/g.3343  ORF Transcript_1429/g.3343 Transcript_1429/m.3343 type:complete len:484 (-) Transcript_1429:535-1986(-)
MWTYIRITNHPALLQPHENDEDKIATKKLAVMEYLWGVHYSKEIARLNHIEELAALRNSGKLHLLARILKLCKRHGHKCLIFSSYTKVLDAVAAYIETQGYLYKRLDGKTPPGQRQGIIDSFNNTEAMFLFLMSVRAGGVGINATGANTVIVFDPSWNPTYDLQAQDRSFRIGQKRKVRVYRLFCSNTVEEFVYVKQLTKQQLATEVIDNVDVARYFNEGEVNGIRNCFRYDGRADVRHTTVQIEEVIEEREERLREREQGTLPQPAATEDRKPETAEIEGVRMAPRPRRIARLRTRVMESSDSEEAPVSPKRATNTTVGTELKYEGDEGDESADSVQPASPEKPFTQMMDDEVDGFVQTNFAHASTATNKQGVVNIPDITPEKGARAIPAFGDPTFDDVMRKVRESPAQPKPPRKLNRTFKAEPVKRGSTYTIRSPQRSFGSEGRKEEVKTTLAPKQQASGNTTEKPNPPKKRKLPGFFTKK